MTDEQYINVSNLQLIRAALRVLPAPALFSAAEDIETMREANIALNKVAGRLETLFPDDGEPEEEVASPFKPGCI